jgi:hypothetical protein
VILCKPSDLGPDPKAIGRKLYGDLEPIRQQVRAEWSAHRAMESKLVNP